MMNNVSHKGITERFTGVTLIEDPAIPEKVARIQLSDKVNLSSEFRKEFDAWLLNRFGADRVVCMINGKMVTNPVNVSKLTQSK